MPIQKLVIVPGMSLSHDPQRWMSVMGPVVLQGKSSARTMLSRLSFTSNPPSMFGGWTYLTLLVSTHGSVGAGALNGTDNKSAKASMTLENGISEKIEDFILPL